MASAEPIRRVEKVVGYPPLVEMDDKQRRDFQEALLGAYSSRTCRGSGRRRSSRRNRTGHSSAPSLATSDLQTWKTPPFAGLSCEPFKDSKISISMMRSGNMKAGTPAA